MIDSLEMLRKRIEAAKAYEQFGLSPQGFGLVTLHRPANVDDQSVMQEICRILKNIGRKIPLIFPVHPRTYNNFSKFGILNELESAFGLHLTEPVSYIPFMNLVFNCRFVLTDSGGIQEETTYIGTPCLTLRPNTERPITVTQGTNRLCTLHDVEKDITNILDGRQKSRKSIDLWDGHAADRICLSTRQYLEKV